MKKGSKNIDVEMLKKIQLEVLIDIANFCEEHNLRYYLGAGTLIGAVRHKGFIPWDDDIDIIMPRPDYIKFIEIYNQKEDMRYTVHSIANDSHFWRAFAQVFDNKTMMVEENLNEKYAKHPIAIDIFPMDGVPENKLLLKINSLLQKVLHVLYYSAVTAYQPSKHFSNKEGGLTTAKNKLRTGMKYIAITIFGKIPAQKTIKLINKLAMQWKFEDAKHVAEYTEMTYGLYRQINKKSDFDDFVWGEFEGHRFHIPVGYDAYLTRLYGDYMQLPPVEKRVSIHSFSGYWRGD